MDFAGWSSSKEVAATVYNVLLRRARMYAVYRYVNYSRHFASCAQALVEVTPRDFVASALAAGECQSIATALRKKGLDTFVRTLLKSMNVALRDVEGSEAEREMFRMQFVAMRVWNGCSSVFFTLNPRDVKSPLLVVFANSQRLRHERVSLDWDDEVMADYYAKAKKENPMLFHILAAEDPAAAARMVPWTFTKTIELLFNCAPPANTKPKKQHQDTSPCKCEPGTFGYVSGYFGVVEPQMRQTEHLHMLVQLLGFQHPDDFFEIGNFVYVFRRVWSFVASIRFRSQEAFAAYCGSRAAVEALQSAPLIPVTPKPQKMLGTTRAQECLEAQLAARGLRRSPCEAETVSTEFRYWTTKPHGDRDLSASD